MECCKGIRKSEYSNKIIVVDKGDNDKKRGDKQERRTIWLRIFGAKGQNSFSRQVFSKYIFFYFIMSLRDSA